MPVLKPVPRDQLDSVARQLRALAGAAHAFPPTPAAGTRLALLRPAYAAAAAALWRVDDDVDLGRLMAVPGEVIYYDLDERQLAGWLAAVF